jgi:hypothetical protein
VKNLDVRVTIRPNRSYAGAFLADFTEPCPYCGVRHTHGAPAAKGAGEAYGHRVPHCSNHTHATTRTGKRARLTADNKCRVSHPLYRLIQADPENPK